MLKSMGSQRVRHDLATEQQQQISMHGNVIKGLDMFLIFPVLTKDMYYFISFPPKDDCICLRGALQARRQQYVNCELPDVQAGFRKGRGTRDQTANIRWIIQKSKRVPEKHLFLLY